MLTALMTFEQFERLPDEAGKFELLRGELIRVPPSKRRHTEIAERLYLALRQVVENLRIRDPLIPIGIVHMEMGYRIARDPDSWLQPDVSVTHPDQPGDDYIEGAPLIAVEVISEANTAAQMEAKIQQYLASGSREVWALYPENRRVWTYFSGRPAAEMGTDFIRSDVIPTQFNTLDIGEILA